MSKLKSFKIKGKIILVSKPSIQYNRGNRKEGISVYIFKSRKVVNNRYRKGEYDTIYIKAQNLKKAKKKLKRENFF